MLLRHIDDLAQLVRMLVYAQFDVGRTYGKLDSDLCTTTHTFDEGLPETDPSTVNFFHITILLPNIKKHIIEVLVLSLFPQEKA